MSKPAPRSSKLVRFAFVSCIHLNEGPAFTWALDLIRDFKPDYLVNGGDTLDSDAASRWNPESPMSLEDEYRIADRITIKLAEAAPNAKKVFLEGNHEHNILAQHRIPKPLRSLCDYRKHIPSLKDWTRLPYIYDERGVFRLGQVSFFHGYAAGNLSDRTQAVVLGVPYGLTVCGHTHRPVPVTQVQLTQGLPLPYWYANAGTLGPLKPEYMTRQRTDQWGAAVVLGECLMGRAHRPSPEWEAEVRMYQGKGPRRSYRG